jgi:hypothetical protein
MGSTLLLAFLLLSHVSSTVWPASSWMGSLGLRMQVQHHGQKRYACQCLCTAKARKVNQLHQSLK